MKRAASNAKTDIENAAREAVRVIASATETAAKTISTAAEAATRVVAGNAAEAARVVATTNAGDHDLLQRVDEKVSALVISVAGLTSRDNQFVLKEDFNFWRNLLVLSMIGTIFVSVMVRLFLN